MAAEAAPAGTVLRVVRVLRAIALAQDGLTTAELAVMVGLPRPTVYRMLALLAEDGMVTMDLKTKRFQPGPEFLRVGARVANRFPLLEIARPVMREVVAETGESCLLGLYLPSTHQMMFAAHEASTDPLGYQIDLMSPVPVAWGASGKAILAFLPEPDIEEILRTSGPSPVKGIDLPVAETRATLEQIRARGFAYSIGEKIPGSRGIAAPVFGPDRFARASLCLTIPEFRFSDGSIERLGALVMSASSELGSLLGAAPTSAA
jgi:DNA-binding IclR family transcriptional regulator